MPIVTVEFTSNNFYFTAPHRKKLYHHCIVASWGDVQQKNAWVNAWCAAWSCIIVLTSQNSIAHNITSATASTPIRHPEEWVAQPSLQGDIAWPEASQMDRSHRDTLQKDPIKELSLLHLARLRKILTYMKRGKPSFAWPVLFLCDNLYSRLIKHIWIHWTVHRVLNSIYLEFNCKKSSSWSWCRL